MLLLSPKLLSNNFERVLSGKSLLCIIQTGTNPVILGASVAPGCQWLLPIDSPKITVKIPHPTASCKETMVHISQKIRSDMP